MSDKLKPKKSGTAETNIELNSISKIQHSSPTVLLLGRIAAGVVGQLGLLGSGGKPDLHFTIIIKDNYSGILGFDGQPTLDVSFTPMKPGEIFKNAFLIQTKIYRNEIPSDTVIEIKIEAPNGMSNALFAQKLAENAYAFSSYTLDYSAPKKLIQPIMLDKEYNSSSYISGLLKSVMGYVPIIKTPGYQTPGWENPIPSSYYKNERFSK